MIFFVKRKQQFNVGTSWEGRKFVWLGMKQRQHVSL